MVGFAESVTVFDADNRSRELTLHPDGKFYDANDYQDNLSSESMHLSEADDDPSFLDAYTEMPIVDGFENTMSFSALNKSAIDLWDDSLSFASEVSASKSQYQDPPPGSISELEVAQERPFSGLKEEPMNASMSLKEVPRLVDMSYASGSERSLTSSVNKGSGDEEEPEKDVNQEVAKQMGRTMMLQGGLYLAMDPIMRLGKRLFRKGGDEEDLVEDAGTTHVMMSRSGQIQHGMLNRGGDISNFAQVGVHESSRNMAGAFAVQQDVTAQVMKQAMIQAAQSAGASVGQGAATMTLAATAGAAAGGATAVVAGGAAAATMSVKFAMGVAIGSVIAAGSLGGATLGSYMVDEELKSNVPRPILASKDLDSYKFDVVELAEGISPTLSPASFYEELASLGIVPTASPGDDLDYDVDPDRPLTPSPVPDFTTSSPAAAAMVGLPTRAPSEGLTGIPTNVLTGSPGSWTGATDNPVLSPVSESSNTDSPTIATTSPVAITTGDLTGGSVFSPTMETSDLTISPVINPSSGPADGSFVADPMTMPESPATTIGNPTAVPDSPTTAPNTPILTTGKPTSAPFASPIDSPTASPTINSARPTRGPVASPTAATSSPTASPTIETTAGPTNSPVASPATATSSPTSSPMIATTAGPTNSPVASPATATSSPTASPTIDTTAGPTNSPVASPTAATSSPTASPSIETTAGPTNSPVASPTTASTPTVDPSVSPTSSPVFSPIDSPTAAPTIAPTAGPTSSPVTSPTTATSSPVASPTIAPTATFTSNPVASPTTETSSPIAAPTIDPTVSFTSSPVASPTSAPTTIPTFSPTSSPTASPTTSSPTAIPTAATDSPTSAPTFDPTAGPTFTPTSHPTGSPSPAPTKQPSRAPQPSPVNLPTNLPPTEPGPTPTVGVIGSPTSQPTITVPVLPAGTITGWSLVSGSGTVLISSLSQGQMISTAIYGTNLRVRALYSTTSGLVNSVSFAISNNNGGGSSSVWDKSAPFETDNTFLRYASVNIKGTPLPSTTNQGNKGTVAELNLIIVGTITR